MTEKKLLDSKVKLKCSKCGNFLALYNPITKLYEPHITLHRQLGQDFFALPVKFYCKNKKHPRKEYLAEKEKFIEGGKIKCEFCKKVLAEFSNNSNLDLKGVIIFLEHANDIKCADWKTNCSKCQTPYDLEALRNKNEDMGIEFE